MDCLGGGGGGPETAPHHHTSSATTVAPFHYLMSEQAKSLAALQELQHEVGALLEFRDLVMETFPNLRTKLLGDDGSGGVEGDDHRHRGSNSDQGQGHHSSNIPVSIRTGEWTPGIRVRKKISTSSKDENRNSKKTDAVQDSGFSTETSSKETHSASSTAPPPSSAPGLGATEPDEVEDELFHLLDIIHRKGTRLKDEAEALQGQIRCSALGTTHSAVSTTSPSHHSAEGPSRTPFEQHLFRPASAEDIRLLRRERDLLLDRLAEAEAEAMAGRARAARLREDLDSLMAAKVDLEEQLRAVVTQRGEVNSRIHDLHLQFVTKGGGGTTVSSALSSPDGPSKGGGTTVPITSQRRRSGVVTATVNVGGSSEIDNALGDTLPRAKAIDRGKVAAILREKDWLTLQRHLLASTVRNQVLQEKLDTAVNLEVSLRDKINKYREENDDLKFQLEDKNIELEGTRARLRVLEDLHPPTNKSTSSPDIIPVTESSTIDQPLPSRSEITTASMKAMSPLALMDHSSSTESAQDQAEKERKRKPSKIPLKSYTAPKPPGAGKHSPGSTSTSSVGPRSRSGDRPHSAQSWRHTRGSGSGGDSSLPKSSSSSLPKSRHGSLVTARDSLSGKLRSTDSLTRARAITLEQPAAAQAEKIPSSVSAKVNTQSRWNLCSYSSDVDLAYPDSLDKTAAISNEADVKDSLPQSATETTSRFQTANTFLWNAGNNREYYDSIDSEVGSSVFHQNGEELAEFDSLEKHFSDWSDQK